MLKIIIPEDKEWYDDRKQEFVHVKEQTLNLEHSLISLSKWESRWHKPFLDKKPKTTEETIDYIRCMTINYQNVDESVYRRIGGDVVQAVFNYIDDSMTATWFTEDEKRRQISAGGRGGSVVTSEIIYYWMVSLQIPFECEKWHLNRLLTLVRVCNEKMQPPKKMTKSELLARNKALNDARRKALNTTG